MPRTKKKSIKKRRQSQAVLIKSLRETGAYRLAENAQSNQRYSERVKSDESFRLEKNESSRRYNLVHRSNDDYIVKEKQKNQSRISKLRENNSYKQKESEQKKTAFENQSRIPEKRKLHCDENNITSKKARLDTVSGPKLRQIQKEAKRKERMNELLKYNETFLANLARKAKSEKDKKTAKLYQSVLAKQRQTAEICTCCMRQLYDCITKLTDYKKLIITAQGMDQHAYHFKESEFLCTQCWNSLRKGDIPKRAATKNLSFIEIPDCLKRLTPLGARLVSPLLPFLQIVPLQQFAVHPQLSLKGNIVNVEVDVGEMMKCLPRRPEEAQVVQIKIKRKKEYKTSYMAENIVVADVKESMKFLQKSTLYVQYGIKENEEFFSQHSQEKFPFIVDEGDKKYLLEPENELFQKFYENEGEDNESDGNFDCDNVLVIDQNREMAELTRIIAPGEDKIPKPMYNIPYYEIFCHPKIFGGEPFDEMKILTANERHKLWLTHKDSRCRHDPTFVLLLGQMTVQKRTRDSMNFVTRRGYKNESLQAKDVLDSDMVDKLVNKDEAYKFLTPIVGSPAYMEDKKKYLIAAMAQIGTPNGFFTFSCNLHQNVHILKQLYEEQYNKKISSSDALHLDPNEKDLLIRNNPVTCARYIHRYFTAIIQCLTKKDGPFKAHHIEDYAHKDEVQQKGVLHRHMVAWLKDAPRYNSDDKESEKKCVEFIDQFITCRLDKDNPYVMGCQLHKHTFTCYKGAKNMKICRFHYPLWPMPETKILTKLPLEERNEKVKSNFEKVKNYLVELSETPREIPFSQILTELEMSENEYINAAKFSLQTTRVFLRRQSNEIFVNAYNIDILNLLKSNMDIQFICDPYACVSYLTDYIVKVEKDMAKLFRNLIEQFAHEDFTNLEKVKKFANAFINTRVLAAQEAAALVLHLPFFKSSRIGVFVPTFPMEERNRVVKRKKELSKMEPDSTDIYQDNIIEKYCKRNKQYESMCLADFATGYSDLNKLQAKTNHDLSDENDSCDQNNDIYNEQSDVKERVKRKILRIRHYNKHQDENNYYRERLLLYLPFREEKSEIEDLSAVERKEVHDKNLILIEKNRGLIYQMDENFLEDIFKEVEAAVNDDGGENDDFNSKKTIEPHELIDIFAETTNNNSSKQKEKDYKISVPKVMENNDILELLLKANDQQLQITMHCLHAQKLGKPVRLVICGQAGTGKSFLIKLLYQTISDYYNKQICCSDIESAKVILAAPSGKAAFVIRGATIHSCFMLPVDNKKGNLPALSSSVVTSLRFEMRHVKVIIIDEVSMIGRNRLNQIDTRLQQITGNNFPFGGLSVIFVGDLRQLPPVMDKPIYYTAQHYLRDKKIEWNKTNRGKPFQPNIADHTYSALFATDNWIDFEYYELTKVMRQDNENFINALNNLSMGTMTENDIHLFRSRCNLTGIPHDAVHIFFTNKDVDVYNAVKIDNMPGELFVHEAEDHIQGKKKLSETINKKILNALHKLPTNKTGCLPKTIYTKIGAKLMLTRNINTKEGLVNGATGVLRYVTKKEKSDEIMLFWVDYEDSDIGRTVRNKNLHFLKDENLRKMNLVPIFPEVVTDIVVGQRMVVRKQFPLVTAEGITAHKSQGQTYQCICVHNKGMTRMMQYVAYSRVTDANNLFIVGDFVPPVPLDDSSDLKVELKRLKNEKCLITFQQPLNELNGIKIIFHNALSLYKNIGCIRNDKWFHGADLIIFAETRTLPTDNIAINGYDIVYRSDENNIGKKFLRGLIVYKKHHLDVSIINNVTHNSRSENRIEHVDLVALFVNDLFVISGYKSPHATRGLFQKCMNSMINSCQLDDNLVIIGDFNEDCYSNEVSWLEKYMNENRNLKRALSPATPTTNFNTQIDMIFSNLVDYVSGSYESITSDHKPIFFCNKANKVLERTLIDHLKSSRNSIPKPIFVNSQIETKNENSIKTDNSDVKHFSKVNESSKSKRKPPIRKSISKKSTKSVSRIKDKVETYASGSSSIRQILFEITRCNSMEEIEIVLQQNYDIINELSAEIYNTVRKNLKKLSSERFNNTNYWNFELKTESLSTENAEINHLLNDSFTLVNVKGDGNCLFRTFAELIYYDEERYNDMKLFIINHIFSNKSNYESLISRGAISVMDVNSFEIDHPKTDDFLRMIARERVWGNEGSLFAISDALKVIVIVIGVNKETHKITNIHKFIPSSTQSLIPLTLINEVNFHFFAAHRKLSSFTFIEDTWQGVPIIKTMIESLFNRDGNRGRREIHRNEINDFMETVNLDEPNMQNTYEILNKIHSSTSLQEIKTIQRENETIISKVCSSIENKIATTDTKLFNEYPTKKTVPKKRFPKELLNSFQIDNVESDGNCFFRAIAELLFDDEQKYPQIKLYIINYVLLNIHYYEVLCKTRVIEIRVGNEDNDILENPEVDDFLRMVAADKIWGNEGSMIAISHGLGVTLLTFVVDGLRSKLTMIIESRPKNTRSSKILVLFNTDNTHFYVARPIRDDNVINIIEMNVEQGIWRNIIRLKLEMKFLYQMHLSEYNELMGIQS